MCFTTYIKIMLNKKSSSSEMKKIIKFQTCHIILGILLSFFYIVPTSIGDNDATISYKTDKVPILLNNISSLKSQNISDNKHNNDITLDKNSQTLNTVKIKINNTSNVTHIKNIEHKSNKTTGSNLSDKSHIHLPELDTGAVIRAFYVFIGFSVIVMAYLIFRSFRLRTSPAQMVRKYGVLAHKQDIEMRPLPLDDDDDDDTTVFDASRLPSHSNQTA